jgi:hypothetical protein
LRATNKRLTKDLKVKLDTLKEEKKNFEDMDALLKVRSDRIGQNRRGWDGIG